MKIHSYLIAMTVVAVSTLSWSCKKSEKPVPSPAIGVVNKPGYMTTSTTIQLGDSVKIAWAAIKMGKEITTCAVTLNGVNFTGYNGGVPRTLLGDEQFGFTDEVKFKPNATGDYNFRVFDGEGRSASFTIRVVVPWEIKEYAFKSLSVGGAPYFSSSNGLIYSESEFDMNELLIDITLAQRGTRANPEVVLLSSAQRSEPSENGTANTKGTITLFKNSSLKYDSVTAPQINAIDTELSTQKIIIQKDKIYEYVNAFGKKGIIKVNDVVLDSTGVYTNINISVKVQRNLGNTRFKPVN